jgi:uncharacterized protein (TIGR02147 family)
MSSIYKYANHYKYLRDRLDSKRSARGTKSRFAEFVQIQAAFLSQVLSEKYPLSLEQADLANEFLEHSKSEGEFFLLLVSRDRAGSHRLRKHFDEQIEQQRAKANQLVARLGQRGQVVSPEAKGIYYSSWIYSAIHVACTIEKLQTRNKLAQHLRLPSDLVAEVLHFLIENQLLKKEDERYLPTETWLRLDKASPHIIKHHSHWRQKAIESLELETAEDLHYSGVFSMDAATAAIIKENFLEFFKKQQILIAAAPEEELFSIGIDLFRLIHPVE